RTGNAFLDTVTGRSLRSAADPWFARQRSRPVAADGEPLSQSPGGGVPDQTYSGLVAESGLPCRRSLEERLRGFRDRREPTRHGSGKAEPARRASRAVARGVRHDGDRTSTDLVAGTSRALPLPDQG